jgi:hypothetical protein
MKAAMAKARRKLGGEAAAANVLTAARKSSKWQFVN